MTTFKVIDKVTHDEISAETVTDYAGGFFALADSGQLYACWFDAWHDCNMVMMNMDECEVVFDEARTV